MHINIPDTYAPKIEKFCKENGYSLTLGVTELTNLGLLAYEMLKKSNLISHTYLSVERENFKIDPTPYLPTNFLKSKKFLTQLPAPILDKIDMFKDANKLSNRSLALSVLLRFSMQKYHSLEDKPSISFLKPLRNVEKSIIVSDDKCLFEELIKFQQLIHVKQRNISILFLLQLAFEELEKE